MITKTKEEWMVTIEGWYQEIYTKERRWELEKVIRNIFGETKEELAKNILGELKCQNTAWLLENNGDKALKRLLNVDKLEKAIIELIETPIK